MIKLYKRIHLNTTDNGTKEPQHRQQFNLICFFHKKFLHTDHHQELNVNYLQTDTVLFSDIEFSEIVNYL